LVAVDLGELRSDTSRLRHLHAAALGECARLKEIACSPFRHRPRPKPDIKAHLNDYL